MKRKILVSLTTLGDWKSQIVEIENYNLTEIALFLTGIEKDVREDLYYKLEKSPVEHIPHIHIRDDMSIDELEYLQNKYGTKLFNLHHNREYKHFLDSKFRDCIYIENTKRIDEDFKKVLSLFAGLCFDVVHWPMYEKSLGKDTYKDFGEVLKNNRIGCCHISVDERRRSLIYKLFHKKGNHHHLINLKELDYVKDYLDYLPEYVSIEINNSIEDKLKARDYLEKIINS